MKSTGTVENCSGRKDLWDKFQIVSSGLLVPLVIGGVGIFYGVSQKESENRVKYVEIAVEQLRSAPTPETATLREWAVELLDNQSPIKLSAEAKAQLRSYPLARAIDLSATAGALASGSATLTAVPPGTAR